MKFARQVARLVAAPNSLQLAGFALIAAGVCLVFLPAGLIVAGILVCVASLGVERSR